jgi:hypothetical protein
MVFGNLWAMLKGLGDFVSEGLLLHLTIAQRVSRAILVYL